MVVGPAASSAPDDTSQTAVRKSAGFSYTAQNCDYREMPALSKFVLESNALSGCLRAGRFFSQDCVQCVQSSNIYPVRLTPLNIAAAGPT